MLAGLHGRVVNHAVENFLRLYTVHSRSPVKKQFGYFLVSLPAVEGLSPHFVSMPHLGEDCQLLHTLICSCPLSLTIQECLV